MHIRTLLKRPLINTLIFISVAIVLALVFDFMLQCINRVIYSQIGYECISSVGCSLHGSLIMNIVGSIVSDFIQLSRYAAELAGVFFIAQLITRMTRSKKK